MDFKAFCRSVLLAQNRFSDFLKATPGQRDEVLKGVFGYERLDEAQRVARLRLQQVEMEVASLEKERRSVDDARAQLEDARTVAASAHARLRALEDGRARGGATGEGAGGRGRGRPGRAGAHRGAERPRGRPALPGGCRARGDARRGGGRERGGGDGRRWRRPRRRGPWRRPRTPTSCRGWATASSSDPFESLLATHDRQAAEAQRCEEALTGAHGGDRDGEGPRGAADARTRRRRRRP